MKVKILVEFKYVDLENAVNEFLDSVKGKIIDIKFAAHSDDSPSLSDRYSALIMYLKND